MNIRILQKTTLLLSFLFFILYLPIEAQVTIGSDGKANDGSLLDLKENNNTGANASRGLMLPRVKLVDHSKLQPMYSYTEGDVPTEKELLIHEGLTVFNINQCAPFGFGTYVWNGKMWDNISNISSLPLPSETISVDTLHIPSGLDARESSPVTLTFKWANESPEFDTPISAATGNMSGPVEFTSPRGLTPESGKWSSSPATLSVWANDMPSTLVTASSPWKTRQSKLSLLIPGNDCGPSYTKSLLLNQTNYAMIAGDAINPVTNLKISNTDEKQIKILSNVPWKATVVANSPDWNVERVLESYMDEQKDELTNNGTTGTDYNFAYKGASAGADRRFTSVTVTLKDPGKRAKDIEINIEQCQGTPIMSGVYKAASPSETSSGNTAWSGKVVFHPAKTNVYKEFYSADFGVAGRWMITNLAASAYDEASHSASRTLSGPQSNSAGAFNTAYWAYPGNTSLTDASDYNKNPFIGYLYTWDAATGGKGGSDGKSNVDKYGTSTWGWPGDRSEAGMPEWTGEKDASNRGDSQIRRQGICPKGWHIPSDYEWTELEQEIIRNTKSYSNVLNNIDSGDGTQVKAVPQAEILSAKDTDGLSDGWRGTTHGQAMKDACELDYRGTSKHPAENGFSLQLAGYGDKALVFGFGQEGMYWTSSIAHGEAVYGRKFGTNGGVFRDDVYRYRPYRYYQFSVRCKKD